MRAVQAGVLGADGGRRAVELALQDALLLVQLLVGGLQLLQLCVTWRCIIARVCQNFSCG